MSSPRPSPRPSPPPSRPASRSSSRSTSRPPRQWRAPKQPVNTSRTRWVDPRTWVGALVLMVILAAVLWVVQIVNSAHRLTQFGLQARDTVGLRGIVTEPFLHADWGHLLSNTLPLILIGWVVLLSGVREWLVVTGIVVLGGGLLTWLVAPGDVVIVGASGVVFGWLGHLLARAVFSREVKWIVVAVVVLAFFGTLLFGLLPSVREGVSWQAHACGFVAGVLAAALLHDPRGGPGLLARPRRGRAVS